MLYRRHEYEEKDQKIDRYSFSSFHGKSKPGTQSRKNMDHGDLLVFGSSVIKSYRYLYQGI